MQGLSSLVAEVLTKLQRTQTYSVPSSRLPREKPVGIPQERLAAGPEAIWTARTKTRTKMTFRTCVVLSHFCECLSKKDRVCLSAPILDLLCCRCLKPPFLHKQNKFNSKAPRHDKKTKPRWPVRLTKQFSFFFPAEESLQLPNPAAISKKKANY